MESRSFKQLLRTVEGLTPGQRGTLLRIMVGTGEAQVQSVLHTRRGERPACPHCHHPDATRWGQSGGLPRWSCKGCRRTFNPLTATPLARLRFRDRWSDHAEAFASGDTLQEVADRCGIHRNTAHRWRRRFLAVPAEGRPERLAGIAEADETFFLRSAKGQPRVRAAQGRLPRKRGGKAVRRGRSKEQVCVLVARDRAGNTVQHVCAKFDAAEAVPVLSPVLSRDVILCTDGHRVYQAVAKARGIKHKPLSQSAGIRVLGAFHIQNVNGYHSRLKQWMTRFNGVATSSLPLYLAWFREVDRGLGADLPQSLLRSALGSG